MAFYKRRKFWAWVSGIFLFFILLISTTAIYISNTWKPLLSQKIRDGVYQASDHLYHIDFKDIHLNIINGSMAIDEVSLLPDTTVYQDMKNRLVATPNLYEIRLKKLRVTGVNIWNAYFKRNIVVSAIILDQPSIKMTFTKLPKQPDTAKTEKTLYEQISASLNAIEVKTIKVADADFSYINKSAAGNSIHVINHLEILVKDFLIDSLSQYDTTRFYYTQNVLFRLAGYSALTKNKLYTLQMDTLNGSASSGMLDIRGFKLIPTLEEREFCRQYKVQHDRYDFAFNHIALKGIDFKQLINEQFLHVASVKVDTADLNIFMSRELPPPTFDKSINYPHNALKRLPFALFVDTVRLDKVDVAYSEYTPESKGKGTVKFQSLNGTISNITNDSVQLVLNNHTYANLHASLMGKSTLNATIDFNLTDKDGAFSYTGSMKQFDLRNLSNLSKQLGLVEIESGTIQELAFSVDGNNRKAKGKLNMLYTDLHVKLLTDNIDGKGLDEKPLLSFLANKFLIRDENPKKGEEPRTAEMEYARINSGSFFNIMWKTVYVGMRDIVGLGNVPMKNPVEHQKEVIEKVKAQKKKDRDKRK